jgi:adenosylmethionine-8-amino-7-oxononanoate aminotransferase
MKNILGQKLMHHTWQPCTQMDDYKTSHPINVTKAYGSYFELDNGSKVIDATSSWWCKSLGHSHPRLKHALINQCNKFEHIIGAGTTNEVIAELSFKLTNLTPSLKKVFYASDGSSAVEIALKMSLHAQQLLGNKNRTKFIALSNGYHGETTGALSVSDVGKFKQPYEHMLFKTDFISNIPYVNNVNDPLWHNCQEIWRQSEDYLNFRADEIAAIIIEPIVQGSGGMKIYSQDFLSRLSKWAKQNNIYIITDEIMTGFGRAGKMFAFDYAKISPDFVCIGKALTAGWLPLSAVITSNDIYDIFDNDDNEKSFIHSNTFYGNALAASVAIEALNIYDEENIADMANRSGQIMLTLMEKLAVKTGMLSNVRGIGMIAAADIIYSGKARVDFEFYKKAMSLGALIRPLGNTLYWLPPINTELYTLEEISHISEKTLSYMAIS